MREKLAEQKLVSAVKKSGGICPKFTSPGFDGMPDRIALLPGGRMAFVEVKAMGKKLQPLQKKRKQQLEALDFSVFVVDDEMQIEALLCAIRGDSK